MSEKITYVEPDGSLTPRDDQEPLTYEVDWTKEEEAKAKRK